LLNVPQKDVAQFFVDVVVCISAAFISDGQSE